MTAARVIADHVVVGRDGAPLPAGTASRLAACRRRRAAGMLPTRSSCSTRACGWDTPWAAAGLAVADTSRALDLRVTRGDLGDVRGTSVAVSNVVAAEGRLKVGDVASRAARGHPGRDAARRRDLRPLGRARRRGAGRRVARRHASTPADEAVFVAGGPPPRSLARYADAHPGVTALTRRSTSPPCIPRTTSGAWGVWLIIGLSVDVRRPGAGQHGRDGPPASAADELATIRLLGGTAGQADRAWSRSSSPRSSPSALAAGAVVAAIAMIGVPKGVRGIELTVSVTLVAGLAAGAALLGLAAGAVTARKAIRVTPAAAMRVQE